MAHVPKRGNSFKGLTSKERRNQLRSLQGSTLYNKSTSESEHTHDCSKCSAKRKRIQELEDEFQTLRDTLLSKQVLNEIKIEDLGSSSSSQLALVQESAKLRITIDTLMRFQVCSTFFLSTHKGMPLCFV